MYTRTFWGHLSTSIIPQKICGHLILYSNHFPPKLTFLNSSMPVPKNEYAPSKLNFSNYLTCQLLNIFELIFWKHPNMHFTNSSLKECFPTQFIKEYYIRHGGMKVRSFQGSQGVRKNLKLFIISFFNYSSRYRVCFLNQHLEIKKMYFHIMYLIFCAPLSFFFLCERIYSYKFCLLSEPICLIPNNKIFSICIMGEYILGLSGHSSPAGAVGESMFGSINDSKGGKIQVRCTEKYSERVEGNFVEVWGIWRNFSSVLDPLGDNKKCVKLHKTKKLGKMVVKAARGMTRLQMTLCHPMGKISIIQIESISLYDSVSYLDARNNIPLGQINSCYGYFYSKRSAKNGQKLGRTEGLQAGVLRVPSGVKTWFTAVFLTNWGL
ncbi:hypothetical protein VP01_1248g2 [Puccinia sorghi]|uniref:Uncharacterized protein n=1 Tax=Puccinia sorghi TaxID=27349 RepID=A0A0L6VPG8_9BASI|nr:hypothetical protein VP01_1248g2 [Puccinia sorghi]